MTVRPKINGLKRRLEAVINDIGAVCVEEHERYRSMPDHEKRPTGSGQVCMSTIRYLEDASHAADQARLTLETVLRWPEVR